MVFINLAFPILLVFFSVFLTKNKYNIFLIANIISLSTTFLFPAIADLIGMDITKSSIGLTFNLISFLSLFVFYLLGRHNEKHTTNLSQVVEVKTSFFRHLYLFSLLINVIFIIYMVGVYGFSGAFINSRFVVYTESRVGTGQIFYVAGTFFNIYAILGLFYNKKWIHILTCIVFALPYGSKARILTAFIYLLIYLFIVDEKKSKYRSNKYLVIISVLIPIMVFVLFWLTSIDLDSLQIVELALGFGNEYQSNFNELIAHFNNYFHEGYLHGKILFEEAFYPFIPRALWTGKPFYFGSLYISYRVYPTVTEMDLGAPSFGPFGQAYVDFGLFGLIQIVFQQSILGYFLGKYEIQTEIKKNIKVFLLLICVGFGGVFGLGGATNPLIMMMMNLIFAKCLILMSRIVLKPSEQFIN